MPGSADYAYGINHRRRQRRLADAARYIKSQLIQQLRQHPQFAYLRDIQYRILPTQTIEKKITPLQKQTLSPENKKLLQMTAETVNHPLLKRALTKLAKS